MKIQMFGGHRPMEVIDAKMDIKITENDIGRTQRIGKPKNNGKSRPAIIKFVRYNDRKDAFSSKGFGFVNNGELGCIPYEEIN